LKKYQISRSSDPSQPTTADTPLGALRAASICSREYVRSVDGFIPASASHYRRLSQHGSARYLFHIPDMLVGF
jgi:hypothetical protein